MDLSIVQNKIDQFTSLREQQLADIKELSYLERCDNLLNYNAETPILLEDINKFYCTHNPQTLEPLYVERKRQDTTVDSLFPPSSFKLDLDTKTVYNSSVPFQRAHSLPHLPSPSPKPRRSHSIGSEKQNSSTSQMSSQSTKQAMILKRYSELKRDGILTSRQTKTPNEPEREKDHTYFMIKEIRRLAKRLKEDRETKIIQCKKISQAVIKWHEEQQREEKRQQKVAKQEIFRVAKWISREVLDFWSQIGQLVWHKHQTRLDEKKQQVLHERLDFLVDQSEKYSTMLARDLTVNEVEEKEEDQCELLEDIPNDNTDLDRKKSEKGDTKFIVDEEAIKESQEIVKGEETQLQEKDNTIALLVQQEEKLQEDDQDFTDNNNIAVEPYANENPDNLSDSDDLPEPGPDELTGTAEIDELEEDNKIPIETLLARWKAMQDAEEGKEKMREIYANPSDTNMMKAAAAAASKLQPTGFTLKTTKVKTKIPFLLKYQLREYQHIGLDWLMTMYEKRLNGILADEMGLGKTIMTIAVLAHLACEKGIWGPHLIIVPTCVLLNWDMEIKKWFPAFKILTYYGTPRERHAKRRGWTKPNAFHVCITSYKLAIQDFKSFRRRPWHYLILDEAHNIKNFRAQRWQTLLGFRSKRRLLLTGTPLQNDLMELWSLMHFLMPNVFASHSEFKDWFSNPVNSMIEGAEGINTDLVQRLHSVLRPFILRRLKKDVEKQLPQKYEHVLFCRLSKRQRYLYEEFISNASTQDTLKSGNFMGIANILMQLRKVCNHPDLFEPRPILSPYDQQRIEPIVPSLVVNLFDDDPLKDMEFLNIGKLSLMESNIQSIRRKALKPPSHLITVLSETTFKEEEELEGPQPSSTSNPDKLLIASRLRRKTRKRENRLETLRYFSFLNDRRLDTSPIYGQDLIRLVTLPRPLDEIVSMSQKPRHYLDYSDVLRSMIVTHEERSDQNLDIVKSFVSIIPAARAPPIRFRCFHREPSCTNADNQMRKFMEREITPRTQIFHPAEIRTQMNFPDRGLIQYDCGKLQHLDLLLRKLKREGHRALIFTQMTKMLDVFEAFLNLHGHTYLRLDGATRVEKRQQLMERYNNDPKIFLFILSTRAGGLGINLVGADTVIFYDSDWNPAMDQQAQDRCHRIGQTREVHIYRLISEHTIEENILKKARQKRDLQKTVIRQGNFTTDFFSSIDLRGLIRDESRPKKEDNDIEIENDSQMDVEGNAEMAMKKLRTITNEELQKALATAEDETDVEAAKKAMDEQIHEAELQKEFSDDEPNQEQNGQKKNLAGKAKWEDELTSIQKYALNFLQVIDPILDEKEVLLEQKQFDTREEEWKYSQINRLKEDKKGKKRRKEEISSKRQKVKVKEEDSDDFQPQISRQKSYIETKQLSNGIRPKRTPKRRRWYDDENNVEEPASKRIRYTQQSPLSPPSSPPASPSSPKATRGSTTKKRGRGGRRGRPAGRGRRGSTSRSGGVSSENLERSPPSPIKSDLSTDPSLIMSNTSPFHAFQQQTGGRTTASGIPNVVASSPPVGTNIPLSPMQRFPSGITPPPTGGGGTMMRTHSGVAYPHSSQNSPIYPQQQQSIFPQQQTMLPKQLQQQYHQAMGQIPQYQQQSLQKMYQTQPQQVYQPHQAMYQQQQAVFPQQQQQYLQQNQQQVYQHQQSFPQQTYQQQSQIYAQYQQTYQQQHLPFQQQPYQQYQQQSNQQQLYQQQSNQQQQYLQQNQQVYQQQIKGNNYQQQTTQSHVNNELFIDETNEGNTENSLDSFEKKFDK